VTADGDAVEDDDILIFVNAWWEPLKFQTPADVSARSWEVVCDTFDPAREGAAAGPLDVGALSILVLRAPRGRTAMT